MMMKLKLLYVRDQVIEIDEDYIGVFGRDSECDIHVDDGLLSRQHGEFYVDQGRLYVRDLGSKNGIYIKRQKITDEEVKPGDKIKLGNKNFFEYLDENVQGEKLQQANEMGLAPTIDFQNESEEEQGLVVQGAEKQDVALGEVKPASTDTITTQKKSAKKDKELKKTLMYFLIGGIFLVASISLYKKDDTTGDSGAVSTSGPMTEVAYKKVLDKAAVNFNKAEYQKAMDTLRPAVDNFNNNDAASIVISLAQTFLDKGDKYKYFDWAKAESLAKELLDSHPVSKNSKLIAGKVLKWIDREEPMMTKVQGVMDLVEKKNWEKALLAAEKLPTDSTIVKKYTEEIKDIKIQYVAEHSNKKDQALKKENWKSAIEELKFLIKVSDNPEVLEEEVRKYQRYIRDRSAIAKVRELLDEKAYNDSKEKLESIEEDSPYYANAKRLKETATAGLNRDQLSNLYTTGNIKEALGLAKEINSTDALLISKMKQIDALYSQLQQTLKSGSPEAVAPICKKIILLEPSKNNFYNKSAKKSLSKWTDSSVLAKYYVQLGDDAYAKDDYETARKMYNIANSKDDFYGIDGIKIMDKRGVVFYNKAVHAVKLKNNKDARSYLRKALKLLAKDSRYHDKMVKLVEELNK